MIQRSPIGLTLSEAARLFWMWLALLLVSCVLFVPPAHAESDLQLTDEEWAWLAEHPTIRIAPAPNFPPVEFFDEAGVYHGIAADHLALIEARLGIDFEIIQLPTWSEVVEATKRREVDAWLEAGQTPERDEFLLFTEPWLRLPAVVIVRHDTRDVDGLDDLSGRKVAVARGYATETYLRENFKDIEVVPVPSVAAGLERVSFGSVDATVGNIATAGHNIEELGLVNLRVAGESGFTWELRAAARNDWPLLRDILQKALDATGEDERRAIRRRWIALEGDTGRDTTLLFVLGGLLAVMVLVLIVRGLTNRGREDTHVAVGGRVMRDAWPVFVTAAVAITAVVVATLWSASLVRERARGDVGNALRTVLNTTSQAVYDWLAVQENEVRLWGERPGVRSSCLDLLRAATLDSDGSAATADLTKELEPLLTAEHHTGFLLLDRDARVLATDLKGAPSRLVLPDLVGFVDRVLESPRLSAARLPSRSADGTDSPMLVGAVIHADNGEASCVLALRLDPAADFSAILQRGRIGESGETYAFNHDGLLVSASRFDDELRRIGLIRAGLRGLLNLEIRDPGGNLLTGYTPELPPDQRPLTVMAQSAVDGKSSSNLIGYNDYRGVPVIGMWVWDAQLGLGITTEMDVDEAYAFLQAYQSQIWAGTLLAAILIVGLTGLFLRNRVKMAHAAAELAAAYEIVKLHKDRMQEELNVGREIQMSMVPLTFPAFPERDEFSVHATLQPAREVGGDFYDFFFVDDARFCFCVGDVAGKGVPSALFMAVTQTLIKSRAADDTSTASVMTHVNNELSRSNKESMFVTVFIGILDITTGEVTYTNAGHNPPYLRRNEGELVRLGERHGPILGAVEGITYLEARIVMDPEDLLLLYTDGVTEAFSNDGELFSEERLRDVLGSAQQNSAESTVDQTVEAIRIFENGAEQADDITVLAVRFYGSDNADEPANQTIKIEIENDLSELEVAIERFKAFADDHGMSQKLSQKVKTVLDEVLNNVVSYAFQDGARHLIEVTLRLTDRSLTVAVRDDGVPFNPLGQDTPQTDQAVDERQIGGLGIHLVRNLTDEVSYQRHSDANVLTMMFHVDRTSRKEK